MAFGKHMDDVFLDAIERVRRLVPHAQPKTPMLVLCGSADAGRSTVMAALTGLPLQPPANQHPLLVRVDYRRDKTLDKIVCSSTIVPAPGRRAEDKAKLVDGWEYAGPAPLAMLGKAMEDAARRIANVREETSDESTGEGEKDNRSSNVGDDGVRIIISGPNVPRLTIVDLPDVGHLDQAMIHDDRVVMIPVVSLTRSFSEQTAIGAVRKLDPQGRRSLAVLTHADAAGVSKDNLEPWNNPIGFHILCNRPRDRPQDHPMLDAAEDYFFSSSTGDDAKRWAGFPRDKCGIKALRKRLGDMLGAKSVDDAGLMVSRCELAISDLSKQLLGLDVSQPVLAKRRQLTELSARFEELMAAAVKDDYEDVAFFDGPVMIEQQLDRRIGAAVNSRLLHFSERMRANGRNRTVVAHGEKPSAPSEITREDYVKEAKVLIGKRQGWEIAGLFNPTVVFELFKQQARPWKEITEATIGDIIRLARRAAAEMVRHLEDTRATRELERFVAGRIAALERDLLTEVDRLMRPHCGERVLATLTERVKDLHKARKQKEIKEILVASFGARALSETAYSHPGINYSKTVNYPVLMDLKDRLEDKAYDDMETAAASAAVDYAEEYYKVALDRFVDQVADYALDRCLLSKLPYIFTPLVVSELSDEVIDGLLSTSDAQRAELLQDLGVLQTARDDLEAISRMDGTKGDICELSTRSSGSPFLRLSPHQLTQSFADSLTDPSILVKLNEPATPRKASKGARSAELVPTPVSRVTSGLKETYSLMPVSSIPAGMDLTTLIVPGGGWEQGNGHDNRGNLVNNDKVHAGQDTHAANGRRRDYVDSSENEADDEDEDHTGWVPGTEVPPEEPLPFLAGSVRRESWADEVENSTAQTPPTDHAATFSEYERNFTPSNVGNDSSTNDAPPVHPPLTPGWSIHDLSNPGWTVHPTQNNAVQPRKSPNKPGKKQREARRRNATQQQTQQTKHANHNAAVSAQEFHSTSSSSLSCTLLPSSSSSVSSSSKDMSSSGGFGSDSSPSQPREAEMPAIDGHSVVCDIAADPVLAFQGTTGASAAQRYYERDAYGVVTQSMHLCTTPQFKRYSPEELRLIDYSLPGGAASGGAHAKAVVTTRYHEQGPSGEVTRFQSICALPPYVAHSFEELRLADYASMTNKTTGVARMVTVGARGGNMPTGNMPTGNTPDVRDSIAIFSSMAGLFQPPQPVEGAPKKLWRQNTTGSVTTAPEGQLRSGAGAGEGEGEGGDVAKPKRFASIRRLGSRRTQTGEL
jgi:hypothetical protein